jgi:FkbM family methyltransferase
VKLKELFYLLEVKPRPQTYGYEVGNFALPKDGNIQYAQWLHPRETGKRITQESVDELRRFLSPGDAAIDIGAHTGDSTIPMALAVGKTGCVLALEPNKYVFPVLEKNSQLNPQKTNIIPLMFAATPEDAELKFQYSDAGFCNGGRFEGISRWRHAHSFELAVQGRNLQSFLRENYPQLISRIRYIKIDAEGYDSVILQSLHDLISGQKPLLKVEVYKGLSDEQRRDLYRLIARHGYKVHRVVDESNYLGEVLQESDLNKWRHFDVFCLPV